MKTIITTPSIPIGYSAVDNQKIGDEKGINDERNQLVSNQLNRI